MIGTSLKTLGAPDVCKTLFSDYSATDIDLLQDRHADGHTTPLIDSHQDYELISLVESGGKTTMKFKRTFETCDQEDNAVQVNVFPCCWFIE